MTKSKKGVFRGAWLDPTIPTHGLVIRIQNEPGQINCEVKGPVIQEVIYQHALWEFDKKWKATEPEAAHWQGLITKIKMSKSPDWNELYRLESQINQLPLNLLALFDGYVFRHLQMGWRELVKRAIIDQSSNELNVLREMLTHFSQFSYKAKRGPKLDSGPALSAVTKAIMGASDLKKPQARQLAADLLTLSGVRVPQSKSQQVERTKKI